VTIPYQCQLLYKGQPVTVVLPDLAVPKCNNCGELVFDYEADEQINQAFETLTRELDQPPSGGGPQRRHPEPKPRELTDDEKEQIRQRLERGEGDTYQLAREFDCSSSQVAGIKAAMNR
jgi:CENP-B N-terminal DNA-binding domain